jgi:hypothetical protein
MAKARLAAGKSDPSALALLKELECAVSERRVLCPYSFAHVMESSKYDNSVVRRETTKLLGQLSGGRCFKWPFDVVRDELSQAISAQRGIRATSSVLGTGLDCFARNGTTNSQRLDVAVGEPVEQFARIVESLYVDRKARLKTDSMVDLLHAVDCVAVPSRARGRPTLQQCRASQHAGFVDSPLFRRIIFDAALRFGCHMESVRTCALENFLEVLPTARIMIEIRARRDMKYDRTPDEGDPIDTVHLLAIPHCDMLLTERFLASIAKEANINGCMVLSDPGHLLKILKSGAHRGAD